MNFRFSARLFLGLLFISGQCIAQILMNRSSDSATKGIITGVVVDSLTKSPIEFANFKLASLKDTSKVLGAVTNKNGRFTVNNIPFDSYSAELSSVGYKKRKRKLLIFNEKVRMIDLDTIKLPVKNILLGEVSVSENQEELVHEKEKIVIPVRKELGDNALEILENLPMLDVDIDGKISMPGKQSVAIYIDGIPLQMAGYSSAEDLRGLSVYEIQKVEVITNPTIEFADAMDSGVINIITRKRIDNKIFGMASLEGDTKNKIHSGVMFNYQYKIFSPSISYFFNNTRNNSFTNLNKTISLNDTLTSLQQLNENQSNMFSNFGRVNLNITADDKNRIFSGILYRNVFTKNQRLLSNDYKNTGNALVNRSNSTTGIQQEFIMLNMNYSRKFDDPQKSILLGIMFYNNSMVTNSEIENNNYPNTSLSSLQQNRSQNFNKNFIGNITYSNALSRESLFRLKYSFDYKRLNMLNNYNNYDFETDSFYENLNKRNDYLSETSTHSLNCSVNGTLFGFLLLADCSLKRYSTGSNDLISKDNFSQAFITLSPSINIMREITATNSITLSYSHRYTPPLNKQLNPHIDYSDTTNLVVGNPNLEPSFNHDIWLGYSFFEEMNYFRSSISYSIKRNIIEPITTQRDLFTSITTYQNVASSKSIQGSLSGSIKLFSMLNINPSLSLFHTNYIGSGINNSRFSWNSRLSTSVSLKNFRFQFIFNYSSPSIAAQSETNGTYTLDGAAKMLFFNRALSLTLKVSDIFNSRRNMVNISGINFYQRSGTNEITRIFSLDLNYFFQSIANEEIGSDGDVSEYADDF